MRPLPTDPDVVVVGAGTAGLAAATALIGFYLSDIEVTVVAIELYRIVDTPMLVALPLFTRHERPRAR